MRAFYMNGILWFVYFVDANDARLVDRTGQLRVATTDPNTYSIYISNQVDGNFLNKVLIHELAHATMVSYNLFDAIHTMTYPDFWIDAEEWVCNFIAEYGMAIFKTAYEVLGDTAIHSVPLEFDRIFGGFNGY